jgi:3-dehydroquinate dehydratase II
VRIAVINGPNLNLLGVREPERYGKATLEEIERRVRARARALKVRLGPFFQSNLEGELVDAVQALRGTADGALINAAAYTHTSLALRDAVLAVRVPFVEVHLSNVFAREEARRTSLLADLAIGVVAGFGAESYVLGLEALVGALRRTTRTTRKTRTTGGAK